MKPGYKVLNLTCSLCQALVEVRTLIEFDAFEDAHRHPELLAETTLAEGR